MQELESSDVDVDRLADRVARASELIAVCRRRIGTARLRIDEVIADLDGPADDPADGPAERSEAGWWIWVQIVAVSGTDCAQFDGIEGGLV